MVNYDEGKIYKIVCNKTGLIYIGSTTKHYLSDRLGNHRAHYKIYLKTQTKYMSSAKILENDDYNIILLESYPCKSKDELLARERHYIELLECVNKNIPSRTKKEWYEDNKIKILDERKKYYEDNKIKILDEFKKYREINRDSINNQKQEYYLKNKERINEQNNIKIKCSHCDKCISKNNLNRHIKKKHQILNI